MTDRPFREHVVILTGAARGMGRAMALQLADQGAWLALADLPQSDLNGVVDECHRRGGEAVAIPTDVSDEAQCARLVAQTIEAFGRVNVLINNAGITMWALFEELEGLRPLERIMQVNYFGTVYCTFYALPHLKQTAGRIIAISSVSSLTGVPYRSGYSASTSAVAGFFNSLRIELEEYGVSVSLVFPNLVVTETDKQAFGADGKPVGRTLLQESKVMTADDAAAIILDTGARRKRQAIMTLRGKLAPWVKLVAPGVVDRVAARAIKSGP